MRKVSFEMLKTIPNFENYAVTKDGRVWSKPKYIWLKPSKHREGYLQVILCKNGKEFSRKIHTLVLITYIGLRPDDMECRHLDGNVLNNNLSNLRWGTHKENTRDSIRHKTHCGFKCGELNTNHKLTEKDVINIIHLWNTKLFTQQEIAKMYNISRSYVNVIINRKVWKHL